MTAGMAKTSRGFNMFGEWRLGKPYDERLAIWESSKALEGAHVWIQMQTLGPPRSQDVAIQFTVAQAKEIIAALQTFVTMAEQDELTEPAVWTRETAARRGYEWEEEDEDDDEPTPKGCD